MIAHNDTLLPDHPIQRVLRYYIRCKGPHMKKAKMLAPDGNLTSRRVHAAIISGDRVNGCLEELRELNPKWTFTAVHI